MRLRALFVAQVVVFLVAVGVLARLVVFPSPDPVARADLVVVLGPYDLYDQLAGAERVLAVSPGAPVIVSSSLPYQLACPAALSGTNQVICHIPRPYTTQGEARFAASYARAHHLSRIAVVAPRFQLTRARLRFQRCWSGRLDVVQSTSSLRRVAERFVYEVGAMAKAELLQRGC
jgi:hypothetical protein